MIRAVGDHHRLGEDEPFNTNYTISVVVLLVVVIIDTKAGDTLDKISDEGTGRLMLWRFLPQYQDVDIAANSNKLKSSGNAAFFVVRDTIVVRQYSLGILSIIFTYIFIQSSLQILFYHPLQLAILLNPNPNSTQFNSMQLLYILGSCNLAWQVSPWISQFSNSIPNQANSNQTKPTHTKCSTVAQSQYQN